MWEVWSGVRAFAGKRPATIIHTITTRGFPFDLPADAPQEYQVWAALAGRAGQRGVAGLWAGACGQKGIAPNHAPPPPPPSPHPPLPHQELMRACLSRDHTQRPSCAGVLQRLEGMAAAAAAAATTTACEAGQGVR